MTEKPPERLRVDRISTPIGVALLVTDLEGRLRALDWEDFAARMRRLLRQHYGSPPIEEGRAPGAVRNALADYFADDIHALSSIECRTGGTPFQRAVWAALRAIPPGETTSYGMLASRIGSPKAVRAVGMANGANPIGLVVPCHRVIGSDRSLTGYGGGLHRKRWLLTHEGAVFRDDASAERLAV